MSELRPDAVEPDQLNALARALKGAGPQVGPTARLVGPDGIETEVPACIHAVLVSIVDNLITGNGVTLAPMHAELTTAEAADLLNVSRSFLTTGIESGELPHHTAGTDRRLRLTDVLAYRDRIDAEAGDALATMTADAEDLGLYER
jgi:excisionase family DNA binding protein